MTMRHEFTRTTKLAAWDRCKGFCECGCALPIHPGDGPEYDHIIPAEHGGSNRLDNCQVLRRVCHQAKTTGEDMPAIVKGRKIRARHANAKTTKRPLPGSRASGWRAKLDGTWERRE